MKEKLKFAVGNAKLSKDIATFSLPCGWTCPFAKACKTRCDRETGKLIEAGHEIRCYAATQELIFRNARKARWYNFDLLKGKGKGAMADLIGASLPDKPIIRLHVSGDFYSQAYFDAWVEVAKRNPAKLFYAYTKAIPYMLARPTLPANFKLIASFGGRHDDKIIPNKLQYAKVVLSEEEAKAEGLKISKDDADAYRGFDNLAHLIHGTQPKNTPAAKAWDILFKAGKSGYKTSYSMGKYARFSKFRKETYARHDA